MNKIIATQKPNGEWVYLPEEFLRQIHPQYFEKTDGLGFLPFVPLVAGGGAGVAAAGSGIATAAKAAIAVIPNLLKNNFWKDAGPAINELSATAQSQLAESKAINDYTQQLIKSSDQQNVAFANASMTDSNPPEDETNYTPIIVGVSLLTAIGVTALVFNRNKKSTSKKK